MYSEKSFPMSANNKNKDIAFNFDNINDGETVYISPLGDRDFKIPVKVKRLKAYKRNEILKSLGISIIQINCPIDRETLNEIMGQIRNKPDEYEELWHRDYGEIDSGNIFDTTGEASKLLDKLAQTLEWVGEYPRFDKFIYRKCDNFYFSEFHTDHFSSNPERTRSYGVIKRALLNLGDSPRGIAVLDIPSSIVKKYIKDPYSKKNYINLLTKEKKWSMVLVYTPPPSFEEEKINGLLFDSFSLVHCGFGKKGELGAVLSHWIQQNPSW